MHVSPLIALGRQLIQLGLTQPLVGLGSGDVPPSIALVIDLDNFVQRLGSDPTAQEVVRQQVLSALLEASSPYGPRVLVVPYGLDEFCVLLTTGSKSDPEVEAARLGERLLAAIRTTGQTAAIGIGSHHPEAGGIAHSFREAVAAAEYKLIYGGDKLFDYVQLHSREVSPHGRSEHSLQRSLLQKLRQRDRQGVRKILRNWLEVAVRDENITPADIQNLVAEAVLMAHHVAKEHLGGADEITTLARDIQVVPTIHEFDYLVEWLEGAVTRAVDQAAQTGRSGRTTLLRARSIIDARFSEKLTLGMVAHETHVSPFQLSRLFKHELGLTFVECLTERRIKAAKRLLATTDLPVGEVGEQVGYADGRYFTQIFKQHNGLTPSEFRERARAGPISDTEEDFSFETHPLAPQRRTHSGDPAR